MKKLAVLSFCVSCMFASIASAETLYIAGASGLTDTTSSNCSEPYIPLGQMGVTALAPDACLIGYPINLPVGKVIDGVEVAYDFAVNKPDNSIVAYLAQNRVKPKLGAIAIAGASAQSIQGGQQGFLNMQSLNIPVTSGSVYWVQIFDTAVQVINYVAVTYH